MATGEGTQAGAGAPTEFVRWGDGGRGSDNVNKATVRSGQAGAAAPAPFSSVGRRAAYGGSTCRSWRRLDGVT